MSHEFTAETGLVASSVDGRAQFGWLNLLTGSFSPEADGRCIPDPAAVEFISDVVH